MPRIRTIKPEFPQSESMGRVSRDARLLFIMLWTLADDSGKSRAASRMLASLLFPYDDDAPGLIDGWLAELEREGCIALYSAGGQTYLQIANWLNHQKIDKPSPSKIPDFDESSRILANPRERSSLDQGPRTKEGKGEEGRGREGTGSSFALMAKSEKPLRQPAASAPVWDSYSQAYRQRYKTDPVRNAKINGQLAQLVKRLGEEAAPVAEYFVANPNAYYVSRGHSVDCLLKDAEKLRTEWATGNRITQTAARLNDRTASNPFLKMLEERNAAEQ